MASAYPLARCPPPATFGNNNGRLTCEGLRNAAGLPDGGYLRSCGGCRWEDDEIKCSHCAAADGRQVEAAAKGKCPQGSALDNHDGKLVCVRRG